MKKIKGLVWILITIVMLCSNAVIILAAAENIQVTDATYYASGALKSMNTKFDWPTGGATSRLVLMREKLRSTVSGYSYGDFTDFGYYGSMFSSFDKVLEHDAANGTFGIITYSDEKSLQWGSINNEILFSFEETDIPLSKDGIYYVYLWTYYDGNYYPDNLFLVIGVKDGVVSYATATGRNSYNEENFVKIESQSKYDVKITSTENMIRKEDSGAEEQKELGSAMEPVVYTAVEGYYFPENYVVESVNGIHVIRNDEKTITVFGVPVADTEITLKAPSLDRCVHDLVAVEQKAATCTTDVGRILRTFKIKKNVEVTDNGKIII